MRPARILVRSALLQTVMQAYNTLPAANRRAGVKHFPASKQGSRRSETIATTEKLARATILGTSGTHLSDSADYALLQSSAQTPTRGAKEELLDFGGGTRNR